MAQALPNEAVVDAIEHLGYKVTSASISLHTGLSIEVAQVELSALLPFCGEGFEVRFVLTIQLFIVMLTRLQEKPNKIDLSYMYFL